MCYNNVATSAHWTKVLAYRIIWRQGVYVGLGGRHTEGHRPLMIARPQIFLRLWFDNEGCHFPVPRNTNDGTRTRWATVRTLIKTPHLPSAETEIEYCIPGCNRRPVDLGTELDEDESVWSGTARVWGVCVPIDRVSKQQLRNARLLTVLSVWSNDWGKLPRSDVSVVMLQYQVAVWSDVQTGLDWQLKMFNSPKL